MVKRRWFNGVVCEQIVFPVAANVKDVRNAKPRERFKNEEERAQHRLLQSKRNHARIINANYSTTSIYSTLTFDNDWEVHTFDEARRIRDNYVRALRRLYPDAKIHIYMGRGKGTHRIHFHMLSDGIPEEGIRGKWKYGAVVQCANLRAHNYYNNVDHGQDYTGLANYLFDHWTEEQGGQRWKATRNMDRPQQEKATPVKRNYTVKKPPIAPVGYKLVEAHGNKFGYLYFKYVKDVSPPERGKRRKKI